MDRGKTNLCPLKSADFKAKNGNRFSKWGAITGAACKWRGEEIIYKVLLSPWFKEEGKASPHSPAEAP